uniref:3-phosphoinositide-dependent protein kinase 1 n=1 Tax=Pyrrhocoris apterus TaxID=37000 RepID=A0AAU7B9I7_PYRAP
MARATLDPPKIVPVPPTKRTTKDFIFGKVIGEGSFSTVYLTKDIHTSKEYAIKVCDKRHIIREKKTEYVKRERDVLNTITSAGVPFFVKLYCTFQDTDSLYFVLSYAKNGELLQYIKQVGAFDIESTRFYAGEILLALEHLHRLHIIHRDLKPENILLDEKMHILITDFGSAKIVVNHEQQQKVEGDSEVTTVVQRRNSFVGTAQYVSPELLTDKVAHYSSDLWALGCIIYQMISGLPPFRARNEYIIFQKILKLDYEFPEDFDADAQDLVQKLLVVNNSERLGAQDKENYHSIRSHPMFAGLDFATLSETTPPVISPFLPTSDVGLNYKVPDHLEPGLSSQLNRLLLGLEPESSPKSKRSPALELLTNAQQRATKLETQAAESKYHSIVGGRLILKQGLVNKRKGLFSRKRMLLLTEGPHIFYVDPVAMTLKGEIPWSEELSTEPKNFKIFFVITPNRTYYLEDPDGFALDWCKAIDDVKSYWSSTKA